MVGADDGYSACRLGASIDDDYGDAVGSAQAFDEGIV
jgi:hypothetical protein